MDLPPYASAVRVRRVQFLSYAARKWESYEQARPDDRRFICARAKAEEAEVEQLLDREMRFDPDLWVVEIETNLETENYLALASE